jgi:hypothetical protein
LFQGVEGGGWPQLIEMKLTSNKATKQIGHILLFWWLLWFNLLLEEPL